MNKNETEYSVLMSVYNKENAHFLKESMESIFKQSVPTNDFVLVCDGPLNDEIESVIQDFKKKYPDILHLVRLKKNSGLGIALNTGLKECKNELVARMDSDDISEFDRCQKQLDVFQKKTEISICSGFIEEFSSDPNKIQTQRTLPEKNEDIICFAKKRCPYNHPCVMYKKSAVINSGGYQDVHLIEDYYLWIKMIQKGYIGYNIQSNLLKMRGGFEMYKRRSGLQYCWGHIKLYKFMSNTSFITTSEFLFYSFFRIIQTLIPNSIRIFIYRLFLRNAVKT